MVRRFAWGTPGSTRPEPWLAPSPTATAAEEAGENLRPPGGYALLSIGNTGVSGKAVIGNHF